MEQGPSNQIVAVYDGNNAVSVANANATDVDARPNLALFVDGKYSPENHFKVELARVNRDLNLPKMVQSLGREACNFVQIEERLGGTQLHIAYHPNPTAELKEGYSWIRVPAAVRKAASMHYLDASNKRVHWYIMVVKGDLHELIGEVFEEDFANSTYKSDPKAFKMKAVKFINQFPFKDVNTFGCYVNHFVDLIQAFDTNITKLELFRIATSIILEFKRHADFNDKEKSDKELQRILWDTKCLMTIVECSKKVEYLVKLIDLKAQKASKDFAALEAAAEQEVEDEKAEKMARMVALKAAKQQNQQKALEPSAPVGQKRAREPLEIFIHKEDGVDDDTHAEKKDEAEEHEAKRRRLEQ